MTEFLLQLCGVKLERAAQLAGAQFALRNSASLGWIIALAVMLGTLAWRSYWRDTRASISPALRRGLTALRVALFVLLLLLLLRPVLALEVETAIRRTLVTLVDASGSMNIRDPRFDEADLKRAALAKGLLDIEKGLDQPLRADTGAQLRLVPRIDLLKAALTNEQVALLEKAAKEFDLDAYTFGQALVEAGANTDGSKAPAWLAKLEAKSQTTALGDAVRDVIMRKRGQPIAGIFLATDGASNAGSAALEAARLARAEGVPLYIYGVGITSPRDLIVANLFTQDVAFVKDELPVTVRVRGQGLRGATAKIVLRLGSEVVAEKDLMFSDDEEQTIALPFTPQTPGESELTASIAPREDEAVKDNNAVTQRLKVIDGKVKVLIVEQSPRWEFRYLQSALLRDRRLEVKCWLVEGDASIAEGDATPYLKSFPQTEDELFKYDLVILGDVGPKELGAAPVEWLGEFVSKFGGSCLFLAGPRSNPASFRGSEFEKMLPVEIGAPAPQQGPERATTLALTAAGRTSPLLRLSPKDEENAAIWRRFPKVYSIARVGRAKPAAQVLMEDSDDAKATKFGKMPVVAQQQYGLGQVLHVGTDNLWRWRRNSDERWYPVLWGQIAQKLGLAHLLGGSKRTQLSADKRAYTTGERVTIYARLYGADYTPVKDATVPGGFTVKLPGAPAASERQGVTLRAVPEQPGMYRGDFTALAPGTHQFSIASDPDTALEFAVSEPKFESGETALNEPLLQQMAAISGGGYFREETLSKLLNAIATKQERIASSVDAELWSSPLYFLLVLAVASAEWALRKRAQLK
jgi:hypothetical protein